MNPKINISYNDRTIGVQNNRLDVFCCLLGKREHHVQRKMVGMLQRTFTNLYVPSLMQKHMRVFVIGAFFGWSCLSLAVVPRIQIGLDQQLAVPQDSFVYKYFQVMTIVSTDNGG